MGNQNRVSPRQVVSLLRHVWANRKDYAPDYVASLSTAGADGTLKSRFKYSPLKHVVRAKTGTLNSYGVSTLAGYVFLPQQTYVFAILINDPGTSQYSHWTAQEKILEAVIPHENQTVVTKTKVPQ
jgi:D-alanyl-D-alanine carboxypeptidase/D-alanyl-D-alanine-endopeptidase (penicillin-binding protein 4)